MTCHDDRRVYPTKDAAVAAAAMQAGRRRLWRIWPCIRCEGAWHAASWQELARCPQ